MKKIPIQQREIFAENIKILKAQLGLGMGDFAKFLLIDQQTLRQWMSTETSPSPKKLDEIGKLLGIPGENLLSQGYLLRQRLLHQKSNLLENTYPYNFIREVFWDEYEDVGDINKLFPFKRDLELVWYDCCPRDIFKMIATLPPRTISILECKYRDGMTQAEIAEMLNLSNDRIRQLITQAKSKIWRQWPKFSTVSTEEAMGLKKEITSLSLEIAKRDDTVSEVFENPIIPPIPIEQLELSVRGTNVLRRAQLRTVQDVLNFEKTGDWRKVRNLGRRTFEEIKEKMAEYGTLHYNPREKEEKE